MELPEFRKLPEEVEWIARIDVKGRIIIPSEIREVFNLNSGDYVKVRLVGILEKDKE
ncbi:AbrB/MazE/SpoVT family DNA-binding domain-containing protein [Thermococcus celericrescens]|uniref:AbrB/MazE/SpoVT family DNA-binding domain-containing protein n=1 Tax=Thermococcus celericrescens TaxID=227598 RepID=UPI0009FABAE2|nr:AbrB/MazE/SpoVT family DNA-binding domain-containing protein [Thermococcus celericrescens]